MVESALSDLTVVELAQGVAGPYCGKLLADLGARVIKLEPPDGDRSRRHGPFPDDVTDPERSGQFLYLNANKQSATVDLVLAADRDLVRTLAATADIIITDIAPRELERLELDYRQLSAGANRLIVTSISPYGRVGPFRDYAGTWLTAYHVGGLGWGTPHNEVTDPPSQPPLAAGGYLADYITGITAATGSLVALAYRDARGVGQLVDVAAMTAVANAIRSSLGALSSNREPPASRKKNGYPWVWPCKDGHVSMALQRDHWWKSLKEMMGDPEWAASEVFDTGPGRQENADVIEPLVTAWLMAHTKQEIYEESLRREIPGFPVYSIAELLTAEQFQVRGSFIDVDSPAVGRLRQPGPAVHYSRTPARIERPAPRLGADNADVRQAASEPPDGNGVTTTGQPAPAFGSPATPGNRPLAGIRVADFGWILSVPHATAWLATLGAEVIRIESQASLDTVRAGGMVAGADNIGGVNRGMGFNSLNFGKKSITLNLKHPEAIALAKELVRRSDVVTENFIVGTMERAGLDYRALSAIKPDIIMLSGSTLGQTGPARRATGWGPNSVAVAGVPWITGYAGGQPSSVDVTYPDFVIGVQMAQALLAALHERRRTGKGQYIEIAMAEAIMATIPEAIIEYTMTGREPTRRGNRHPGMAPHGVYPCAGDDEWVAIAVRDDRDWQGLCRALGTPDWASSPDYTGLAGRLTRQDALDGHLAAWTRDLNRYRVTELLQAEGVPAAPVLNAAALAQDPHLDALGFMVEVDHREVGIRRVPGLPGRFSAMPELDYRPSPLLGEHNEEVFRGLLGLSQDHYDRLVAEKVIY